MPGHVGRAAVDPKDLLEQIRADHHVLRWVPLAPQEFGDAGANRVPVDRSSLEYLHQHWALTDTYEPGTAITGVRGKLVALFGRLTYRVLRPHLHQEREFLAQAVQVIDDLDQRCTELDLRYQEFRDLVLDRQVAEAENQAKLAVWLHVNPPPGDPGEAVRTGHDEGDAPSVS